MRIGIPKEIKNGENRVALTPLAVGELVNAGHRLYLQANAGLGAGFSDDEYRQLGAELLPDIDSVYREADLIVKVKEPQPYEYSLLRPGQILFTYLHLSADKDMTRSLLATGASLIAYETVVDSAGGLPLLAPMSEIAGRLAIQAGAYHLQSHQGGKGVLLGGIPGVAPARVLVLGGGVVGSQAAAMAIGLGAQVTLVDKSLPRLRYLSELWKGRLVTEFANQGRIAELVCASDLVVGAVLNTGDLAPKLLLRRDIAAMAPGSVLVDVAIDQGGCAETSRPTSHQQPTYIEAGVVHYCVANIPSAAARTSTQGLTNATFAYVQRLAAKGLAALTVDQGFAQGLNIHAGKLVHPVVAKALGLDYSPVKLP